MLYLEDYLEMIEHLPQELRDRLTEMREMDLQVQNAVEKAQEDAKQLFLNARKLKPEAREAEWTKIKMSYTKALEDADEKVALSDQVLELVMRYLRKLDQELTKFKMELEADNGGITEVLEKRSLELDNPQPSQNSIRNKKRKHSALPTDKSPYEPPSKVLINEGTRMSSNSSSSSTSSSSSEKVVPFTGQQQPIPYGLAAGSNAIAAAASQAIAATQQMQQGRRTASLKASYEAVNSGLSQFTLGTRDIGSLTAVNSSSNQQALTDMKAAKQQKKGSIKMVQSSITNEYGEDSGDSSTLDGQNSKDTVAEVEPRYCTCNQFSYGDMVACDNKSCKLEWFHYECVDMKIAPQGNWYCPRCRVLPQFNKI